MLTKTRKQGNSLTLTVPKEFQIPEGKQMEPELTDKGIFYRFTDTDETDFFDFSNDILQDLINADYSGNELLTEFKKRKTAINLALKSTMVQTNNPTMTREEFAKEIGL
ncbi:AbrB/MazE/SpoVT family DNA-binding domain-containing protein [Loigolactobacillus zhaoyuanensis]|uniref:SpoVT-AbrB domain-containing protein n=1 Tax=Loigolactobacillus zhaoyuanensis TaxID=2486017 RepID=A0ABW8UDZ9_9LACO|nr:hypothetical protein [Loigolactobacillus zhaoyuanensis]